MSLDIDLAEVRRLEELAFRAWPALETRDIAGWRLRLSGG
jgi:N-acetylglutamate synthase